MKVYTSVIFWMRAIACLSVVMIHAISTTFYKFDMPNSGYILRVSQLVLMYATPMFVFISEFLIAKNYHIYLKENFFKNKLITLGIPYIFINFGLAYVFGNFHDLKGYLSSVNKMMFHGGTVTYFIIIIFQFFILHKLFAKYLIKLSPIKVIIFSIIFSSSFWAMRNLISKPGIIYLDWMWQREGWMIFFGWFCYFILGFYIGIFYNDFMANIQNYKYSIYISTLLMLMIVVYNYLSGFLTMVSSKRLDIPLYVLTIILFVFLLSSYIKYVPKFILFISNYSFSIYLLHFFFVHRLGRVHEHPVMNVIFTFTLSLVFSIIIAYLFNLSKYGKYLVGGIGNLSHEKFKKNYENSLVD